MERLVLGLPVSLLAAMIPGFALLGALFNGTVAAICKSGRRPLPKSLVSLVGVGAPLLSFGLVILLAQIFWNPAPGFQTTPLWSWMTVGNLTVDFSFQLDRLSLVMSLVVAGVGSLIHLYSIGYMAEDAGYARYFSFLNLFLFSMLVLVLGGNLPLLFMGWEGVGLCSYFLISFWFTDNAKAAAGRKAFIVNRIGDFGFLLGMFLIYSQLSSKGLSGTLFNFETMQQYRGELFLVGTPVALLLFMGAMGKSAQIPLYVWLPDAMAGPTPVSALIHAATMVTAGVYMIARLHFIYTLSPTAMQVVAAVGAGTALFAAIIALAQTDIKKILAYSTISQLGTMFLALGVGGFSAAIFHVVTHAFFKACLFLAAGSVIHSLHGEQDIWKMGGLRHKMPLTFLTSLAALLAIVGVFPFAGFFSKDAILWQVFATGHPILWGISFVTAGLTAFYMSRLFALTFLGNSRLDPEQKHHLHESPVWMTLPLILLGLLSFIGGWVGIPEALKGSDHWLHWFSPIFSYEEFYQTLEHKGHGWELLLSALTFVWIFHLGLFAIVLYGQKPRTMAQWVTGHFEWLRKIAYDKFYIDEIYQVLLVRPIRWFSETVLWKFHDSKVVDGLVVHGTAETVGLFGRTFALLQNGSVQGYALFFVIGVVVVVASLVF